MDNNDIYNVLLLEKFFEEIRKDGVSIEDKEVITIDENNIKIENATQLYNKISQYKNALFLNNNAEKLSSKEYEEKLDNFDNQLKRNKNNIINCIVQNKYSNINFENLSPKIPEYISIGDMIYDMIKNRIGNNCDYSSAIMQWCRAVELELRNKFYSFLDLKSVSADIEEKSKCTKYYIDNKKDNPSFKCLKPNNMLGFYGKLNEYGLEDYVFNKYIKQHYYNFSLEQFRKIIEYVTIINCYRNISAHSNLKTNLTIIEANKCKEYILASEKILEMLSKLKK